MMDVFSTLSPSLWLILDYLFDKTRNLEQCRCLLNFEVSFYVNHWRILRIVGFTISPGYFIRFCRLSIIDPPILPSFLKVYEILLYCLIFLFWNVLYFDFKVKVIPTPSCKILSLQLLAKFHISLLWNLTS